MEQVERTRRKYLDQARRAEERAIALMDEAKQDALLDTTISLRVLASLPSYKGRNAQ
ncbi:MAG TPA: hypothetical protein VFG62_00070 [Rhodopila sp.]|jgi:hypothetical protein|nr:hypothetical protein [Rhodopila sp.]